MTVHPHDAPRPLRAVPAAPLGRPGWEKRYALSLAALDLLVVGLSSLIAFELRLGDADTTLAAGGVDVPYGVVVAGLAGLWRRLRVATPSMNVVRGRTATTRFRLIRRSR